jgi:hypothetical protein
VRVQSATDVRCDAFELPPPALHALEPELASQSPVGDDRSHMPSGAAGSASSMSSSQSDINEESIIASLQQVDVATLQRILGSLRVSVAPPPGLDAAPAVEVGGLSLRVAMGSTDVGTCSVDCAGCAET